VKDMSPSCTAAQFCSERESVTSLNLFMMTGHDEELLASSKVGEGVTFRHNCGTVFPCQSQLHASTDMGCIPNTF
jgi:hypothetical protein